MSFYFNTNSISPSKGGSGGGGGSPTQIEAVNNTGAAITSGDKVWICENNGSYSIEKLKEIRNFDHIGNPTIDDSTGIVSRFSSSNYLTSYENANIKIISEQTYKVQTGSSFISDNNYIAGGPAGIVSLNPNGYLRIWSNDASSWVVSSTQLSTQTIYWIRYITRENNKEIQYSTDGISFTSALIVNESSVDDACELYIGHNPYRNDSYWQGTIYIKDCYIKVDGQKVWTPYLLGVTENTQTGIAAENITAGSTGLVNVASGV